jgi:DNA-binding transcriptional ArsR family regulator
MEHGGSDRMRKGSCRPVAMEQRALLSQVEAGGLGTVFKVLASGTRLRLLHALIRSDELSVNELARTIAMKPQAVSNQLQRLADLGVVASRREGLHVHYRLVDLCVQSLLEQAVCLMEASLARGGSVSGSCGR